MSPGTFYVISRSRPHSVGGGGIVAEIVRGILKPNRFGGGRGVVAEIFRDIHTRTTLAGGGGVEDIFPGSSR